jgi:hypothetical protein
LCLKAFPEIPYPLEGVMGVFGQAKPNDKNLKSSIIEETLYLVSKAFGGAASPPHPAKNRVL